MKYGFYYIITKDGAECLDCKEEVIEVEDIETSTDNESFDEEKPDVSVQINENGVDIEVNDN